MTLHCSLVRGPLAEVRADPEELSIAVADGTPGGDLQSEVMQAFSTGELTVGGTPLSQLDVGTAPLVNGAVLLDGGPSPAAPAAAIQRPPLHLLVHTGPAAGTVIPLERGTYRIGRRDATISLPDPGISRNHAELDVTDSAITVTDNKSANGTSVDGREILSSKVSTSSEIRCGSSRMTIQLADNPGGKAGLLDAGRSVADPLIVSRRHDGSGRSQLLLTAGLPLVLGVGMALVTGMWMFLAFTAVSAVAVLAPAMSGRRHCRAFRKAVRAAARNDEDRRRRCSPSAAVLAVEANSHPMPRPAVAGATADPWLRVGTCLQKTNICVQPADPEFDPPERVMPLVLDPANRVITLCGPDRKIHGMIRSLLMQLSSFPVCAGIPLLLHGPAGLLPLAARFLPGALLCPDPVEAGHAVVSGSETPGWLFLMGDAAVGAVASELRRTAQNSGWHVVFAQPVKTNASDAVVDLSGRQAVLRSDGGSTEFDADLVPTGVFDRYCRNIAAASKAPSATRGIPDQCGLAELLPYDTAHISARWAAGQAVPGLCAVVGRGDSGPTSLDLQADGPHLLIAGTTGSGKSEFLRTLVSSLSLSHAPDRVNFLFVDFKGGSGLGPFIDLPHCVGLITDLNQHALERTLMSLRAEVRRREELLALAKAPDLTTYRGVSSPSLPTLPHLVVVVDEFRMLVEERPAALAELMRIAAIGRSLGVHLVMATQRPQGALNADIRANVTTSIALRVQSDPESLDVINSRAAAAIPVSRPGRAFMVRGSAPPEEFQTASLIPAVDGTSRPFPVSRTALGALRTGMAERTTDVSRPPLTPAQAAEPIVEATRGLWAELGGEAPRRPVAGPLPEALLIGSKDLDVLSPGRLTAEGRAIKTTSVCLGLVDLPADQQVLRLVWRPSADGHLGLVGPSGSGVSEAAQAIASALASSAADSHLYILDGDSSFPDASGESRVGAVAGIHEARRAVRILERLTEEVASRQTHPGPEAPVPLVLVVCNWGGWISAFRSGPVTWAEDLLQGLVRDGSRAGITVIISGDRELVASRLFAALPNRAFFPTGSTEESRLAWPRFGGMDNIAGRALASGNFLDGNMAVAQFSVPPADTPWPYTRTATAASRPFRVEPLPALISVDDVLGHAAGSAGDWAHPPLPEAAARHSVLLGLGGDELEPVFVRLAAGNVFLALGSPVSGKTGLLQVLPTLNPHCRWIAPGPRDHPEEFWMDFRRKASAVGEGAAHGLDSGGSNGGKRNQGPHQGSILLVDNAEQLTATAAAQLSALTEMGFTVIATAAVNTALLHRSPLCLGARNHGLGLLIGYRGPADGDFFGVRIDAEPSRTAGRAVLIQDGNTQSIQIAAPGSGPRGSEDRCGPTSPGGK